MWEKEIGVYPVSWSDQSEEWAFHSARALRGQSHWINDVLPGEGSPAGNEVTLNPPPDSSMSCSLRVRRLTPGGIACVAFGDEGVVNEVDARLWQDAAEAAVAEMGKNDQDFGWRAILGAHPSAPEWRRPGPLAEPTVVGPILLTPGGVLMRELVGYLGGRIDRPWPARCPLRCRSASGHGRRVRHPAVR